MYFYLIYLIEHCNKKLFQHAYNIYNSMLSESMDHSTELVKTGGGIKKRIFSLFAYMHYAHYVYFCVHHVFVK